MRKLFIAFIITVLLASSFASVSAATTPKVLLNGTEIKFANSPIVVDGTTMVPFRNLLESLNAKVDYNAETRTITTSANNTTIQLVLGEKVAVKNGLVIQLAQAPYVKNNVTYVPLRFLSQSFGYGVDFKDNTIYINAGTQANASDNKPTLTVQEVGKLTDRVAYIELYNSKGKLYGSGSGVVVDENGGILTNYHVIEGATKAVVHLGNKKYETKKILKQDEERDLALIKIDAVGLPVVDINKNKNVTLGESVVALGSPLGFSNTLTTGIVSNVSREMYGQKFIQFSAPIDHGSSGGALLNMKGELIGITTALVYSSANLNFAIPSDEVITFLNKPSKEVDMVGVTKSGIDKLEVLDNEYSIFEMLYNELGYIFNEEIEFDVAWGVEYDEDKNVYLVSGVLIDYDQYVDLVKYITNNPTEMGELYVLILDYIEYYIGIKNVNIEFIVFGALDNAPNYSIVDSSAVKTEEDGYEFFYTFSHAVRSGNTVSYNTHYLTDNSTRYINMN